MDGNKVKQRCFWISLSATSREMQVSIRKFTKWCNIMQYLLPPVDQMSSAILPGWYGFQTCLYSGTTIYSVLRIGGRLCQTSAYGGPANSKRDPPKEESYLPTYFFGSGHFCVLNGHCPFDSEVSWVHSSLAPKLKSDHVNGEIPSPTLKAHHVLGSEFIGSGWKWSPNTC